LKKVGKMILTLEAQLIMMWNPPDLSFFHALPCNELIAKKRAHLSSSIACDDALVPLLLVVEFRDKHSWPTAK